MTPVAGSDLVPLTQARARRQAVSSAAFIGCAAIAAALFCGNSLLAAVSFGLINGSCGLVLWWAHHLVSRRTDTVGLVWISAFGAVLYLDERLALKGLWSMTLNYLVFIIPLTSLFSLAMRDSGIEKSGSELGRVGNARYPSP